MEDTSYFYPLTLGGTFRRVWNLFRERWMAVYTTSAISISLWYVFAIGVRYLFHQWSLQNTELKSFEMGGNEFTFPWQTHRTTFSRIGLCVEFLLVYLLHLPADATNIRLLAHAYAGNESIHPYKVFSNEVLPRMMSLLVACLLWCWVLLFPLGILILLMAPEGQTRTNALALYLYPIWSKLCGGLVYLGISSAFIVATFFAYSSIMIAKNPTGGFEALKHAVDLQGQGRWKHVVQVLFLWFMLKWGITKIVSALNILYYMQEVRFWNYWGLPGIPLHPYRIIGSSMDLWEIGRSFISVPFVILFASFGSA